MTRLYQLIFISAGFLILGSYSGASKLAAKNNIQVSSTNDLSKLGKLSHKKQLPLLIVFSATHCSYCQILENEFLRPMLISGDYQNKIIIRKIVLDEVSSIRNFNGKLIDADQLVSKFNVSVTPTMLFMDNRGNELTKRLVGINTVDFFGAYLDDAIEQSLKLFKQRTLSTLSSPL